MRIKTRNQYQLLTQKLKLTKTSSNRQRSSVKTSTSQNDISNSCQLKQQDEDVTKEVSFEKSIEMHLLSGSVSFLPEMHLQSYNGSTNSVDDAKEERYVLTTGKAKPGVLRKTYQSLKQSNWLNFVGVCFHKLTIFFFQHGVERFKSSLF